MGNDATGGGPAEQPAVRTTIVGGRPPGCGTGLGATPRGMEVLIKKASVDADFRQRLLADRADAAEAIGLDLTDAERAMLSAIPDDQLRKIIDSTRLAPKLQAIFRGAKAAAMLVALGASVVGCDGCTSLGHTVDVVEQSPQTQPTDAQPAEEQSAAPQPKDSDVTDILVDVQEGQNATFLISAGMQPVETDLGTVTDSEPAEPAPEQAPPSPASKGIRPDVPPPRPSEPTSRGIRPDVPKPRPEE